MLVALYGCNAVEIDTDRGTLVPDMGAEVPMHVDMLFSGGTVKSKSIYTDVGTEAGKLGAIGILVAKKSSTGQWMGYAVREADSYEQYNVKEEGGSLVWEAAKDSIYLNHNEGTAYAWAPVTGDKALSATPVIAADKLTVAGVTLPAAQTYDATDAALSACSQPDYLYATKGTKETAQQTVSKTNHKAELYMHHALARVNFKVMFGKNAGSAGAANYVKKIELISKTARLLTITDGTMNLADGTLEGTSPVETLTFSAPVGKAAEASPYAPTYDDITPQAYGLVVPLPEATKDLGVRVTLGTNDGNTDNDLTIETKAGNEVTFQWEKGKEYTYNIKKDVALKVISVDITDFGDGGTAALPVK